MFARITVGLAVLFTIGNTVSLAQEGEPVNVGECIVLELTGQVATEFALRTGATAKDKITPGFSIETGGTITQKLNDGRIRVEHSTPVLEDGKTVRLVTLTANVEPSKLTTVITPKDMAVYAADGKPKWTTELTKTRRLKLSDINNGVKVSEWKLVEAVGDWRLLLER